MQTEPRAEADTRCGHPTSQLLAARERALLSHENTGHKTGHAATLVIRQFGNDLSQDALLLDGQQARPEPGPPGPAVSTMWEANSTGLIPTAAASFRGILNQTPHDTGGNISMILSLGWSLSLPPGPCALGRCPPPLLAGAPAAASPLGDSGPGAAPTRLRPTCTAPWWPERLPRRNVHFSQPGCPGSGASW